MNFGKMFAFVILLTFRAFALDTGFQEEKSDCSALRRKDVYQNKKKEVFDSEEHLSVFTQFLFLISKNAGVYQVKILLLLFIEGNLVKDVYCVIVNIIR
ncbi:hypothetical protein TNCT_671501 [Trichonephila clavata]|uniref:Uncharacterized protein n=1 Tax=Trichonephila clavata TaxID=2740835 RepID=A0A8X6H8G3_TRICU|nr:hypothetical protein TNCT_671501 [Trichonephila clavata]